MKIKALFFALVCALVMNFAIAIDNTEAAGPNVIEIENRTNNHYRVFFINPTRQSTINGPVDVYGESTKAFFCTGGNARWNEVAIQNSRTKRNIYPQSRYTRSKNHSLYGKLDFFKFECAKTFTINAR